MSKWTRILLGAASAVTLAAMSLSPASAAGFNGTLEGDYAHLSLNGGNGTADQWGLAGSGEAGLGIAGLAAQVDAGYTSLSADHNTISKWNIGGDLFWTGQQGRVGATVNYQQFNCCGITVDATNYGGFAELYLLPVVTAGVKGGAFSGSFSLDGSYLGGEVEGYVMPDLALSGLIDYTSFNHNVNETDYTAQGEWLVSEETPVSVTAGYTRSEFSHVNVSADTFMIGLKLYLNGNGAKTLVDRQRTATESWGSRFSSSAIALQF